jgi:hypothetical protein
MILCFGLKDSAPGSDLRTIPSGLYGGLRLRVSRLSFIEAFSLKDDI